MAQRRRNLRVKNLSDSENEAEDTPEVQRERLKDVQILQRQRKKYGGLHANALAVGSSGKMAASGDDIDGIELMESYVKAAPLEGLSNNEEDPHMQKFIEDEVAKRLGKSAVNADEEEGPEARRRKLEMELYAVPEEFKSQLQQEVIIPGLITGISEVALPLEARLKNIEATEAIKRSLLTRPGAPDDEDDKLRGPDRHAAKLGARRSAFASSFGKDTGKRKADPEEDEYRHRRVVKDPNMRRSHYHHRK